MRSAFSRASKVICFGCLAILPHGSVEGQKVNPAIELTTTQERAKAVIDSVSPAIVRFAYGNERKLQFGWGVILTASGHVVISGPVHAVVDNDLLDLRLIDGRRVRGKALGWSSELGFGMLKITDEGTWPHAEMGRSATTRFGDPCVLIGYPTKTRGQVPWVLASQIIKPTQTLPGRDEWYCEFWTSGFPESIGGASGGGVFDTQGHVIGVLRGGAGEEMRHSRVELTTLFNCYSRLRRLTQRERQKVVDEFKTKAREIQQREIDAALSDLGSDGNKLRIMMAQVAGGE
jgi:S1-C subfamily serine protease